MYHKIMTIKYPHLAGKMGGSKPGSVMAVSSTPPPSTGSVVVSHSTTSSPRSTKIPSVVISQLRSGVGSIAPTITGRILSTGVKPKYTVTTPLTPKTMTAKQCPWCGRWALKDNRCDYIFSCGLGDDDKFHVGAGCGKSFCWVCLRKYCGQMYDPETGKKISTKTSHDAKCCRNEPGFSEATFCPGGHNPHCGRRWT
jgi:hypothetical protein